MGGGNSKGSHDKPILALLLAVLAHLSLLSVKGDTIFEQESQVKVKSTK